MTDAGERTERSAAPVRGDDGGARSSSPLITLASASPRRRAVLEMLGLAFDVRPADLDETVLPGEAPAEHVRRLALEKARALAAAGVIVLGGDTTVALGEEILGKPSDEAEAVEMLLRLQGREHLVHSGIAAVAGDREAVEVVTAAVRMRPFDRSTAEAYVATGEPMDKAGGYGIQSRGSALVEGIEGDYFAVVGLPVAGLLRVLEAVGYPYDFRGLTPRAGSSYYTT